MNTITLKIEGMSCGHCVKGIETVLKGLNGVQSASVSLENKNAEIYFDEQKVTPEQMIQVIEEEGYQAAI